MQVDEQEASTSKPEAPKAEPSSYLLQNPARVTPAQESFISFLPEERWQPLRPNPPHSGILMLNDTRPGVAALNFWEGGGVSWSVLGSLGVGEPLHAPASSS